MQPELTKNNIMVDLETMATHPNAAIVAIGAVRFTEELKDTFYQVVDLQSCIQAGMDVNGDTVNWWIMQEEEARKAITEPGVELTQALTQFASWLGKEAVVWGNGASFDNAILTNAYYKTGIALPWQYYNNRCYRTVKSFHPHIKLARIGTLHNALDDAMSQAAHLINIFKSIKT